jgi:hypothetical protein
VAGGSDVRAGALGFAPHKSSRGSVPRRSGSAVAVRAGCSWSVRDRRRSGLLQVLNKVAACTAIPRKVTAVPVIATVDPDIAPGADVIPPGIVAVDPSLGLAAGSNTPTSAQSARLPRPRAEQAENYSRAYSSADRDSNSYPTNRSPLVIQAS